LVKVLRLLILLCLTNGGLKPKQLEFFKREILQTYGFEYFFTLNNLEKLDLLRKQEGKPVFSTLRKALRLIVEEIDETNPSDIAYVYSGYAPLSCRLIQQGMKFGGWRAIDDLLRALPGPTFEENQPLPPGVMMDRKYYPEKRVEEELTRAEEEDGFGELRIRLQTVRSKLGEVSRADAILYLKRVLPELIGKNSQAIRDPATKSRMQKLIDNRVGGSETEGLIDHLIENFDKEFEEEIKIRKAEGGKRRGPGSSSSMSNITANGGGDGGGPVTLVFFIGGVTFTEIAALRLLAQQEKSDIIIATSKLINGDTIIDSLIERVPGNNAA